MHVKNRARVSEHATILLFTLILILGGLHTCANRTVVSSDDDDDGRHGVTTPGSPIDDVISSSFLHDFDDDIDDTDNHNANNEYVHCDASDSDSFIVVAHDDVTSRDIRFTRHNIDAACRL